MPIGPGPDTLNRTPEGWGRVTPGFTALEPHSPVRTGFVCTVCGNPVIPPTFTGWWSWLSPISSVGNVWSSDPEDVPGTPRRIRRGTQVTPLGPTMGAGLPFLVDIARRLIPDVPVTRGNPIPAIDFPDSNPFILTPITPIEFPSSSPFVRPTAPSTVAPPVTAPAPAAPVGPQPNPWSVPIPIPDSTPALAPLPPIQFPVEVPDPRATPREAPTPAPRPRPSGWPRPSPLPYILPFLIPGDTPVTDVPVTPTDEIVHAPPIPPILPLPETREWPPGGATNYQGPDSIPPITIWDPGRKPRDPEDEPEQEVRSVTQAPGGRRGVRNMRNVYWAWWYLRAVRRALWLGE